MPASPDRPTLLLVIRGSPRDREAVGRLEGAGAEIIEATTVGEGIEASGDRTIDAIVLLCDAGTCGDALSEARRWQPAVPVFVITSASDPEWARAVLSSIGPPLADGVGASSRRLARNLARAERLEALGQMASGIAHDFNNTLMAAQPWADLLRRKYPDDDVIQRAAEQIRRAIRRASDVTRQLLDFAQPRNPEVRRIDVSEFARRQSVLLRRTLPSTVALVEELGTALEIDADPAQVGQVLLNLVLNARDAMPEGGRLTIRASALEPARVAELGIPSGEWVSLTVVDTGTGIEPANIPRIFDPYFTTKDLGMGAGLGLSVAQRIIERHRGFIRVASTTGQGTEVHLVFPRAIGAGENQAIPGGREERRLDRIRVLVIDDDADVVSGLEALLREEGASVETRDRGRSALELLDQGYSPDVVILDLGLPEMPGDEIYRAIRTRAPRLPILIASGWGDAERTSFTEGDRFVAVQGKPFAVDTLVSAIRKLRS